MFTVNEIRALFGQSAVDDGERRIEHYAIDSRTLKDDSVFFALPGERVDGASFVDDACDRGALLCIVSNAHAKTYAENDRVLCVTDVLMALQQLAKEARRRSSKQVIAITGSSGKTTVKELLLQLLSSSLCVTANQGNLNNHIGAPLSFLNTVQTGDVHVAEIGASKIGDVAELAAILQPDIGIITNVSSAHLEGFGSLESIYRTKTELSHYIARRGGDLIVDGDNLELAEYLVQGATVLTSVGMSTNARCRATGITEEGELLSFRFLSERWTCDLTAVLHIKNALMAIVVAHMCGVPASFSRDVLRSFASIQGRYTKKRIRDITVIDDAYNANPASFINSLRLFSKAHVSGRRVLVCSDMLELGEQSESLHWEVGQRAAQLGVKVIVGIGAGGQQIIDGFQSVQVNGDCFSVTTNEEASAVLKRELKADDAVLFKASRGRRLEEVIQQL